MRANKQIMVGTDTAARIKKLALVERESFNSIIKRMLALFEAKRIKKSN